MKTEAFIKQQAREALRGNITKLIAAAGVTALAFLLLEYLEYLALTLVGAVNTETGEIFSDDWWRVLPVLAVYTVSLMLASPLLNGFVRMAAGVAVNKECSSLGVVYYFTSPRLYLKTVLVNFLLYLLFSAASGALDLSGYLALLLPDLFDAEPGLTLGGFLTVFMWIITGIIRVLLYMLLVHYPLMSYAFNDEQSIGHCVFVNLGFSFRHFWQLLKLALSFAGWFALCFFVVPALYVLPYFAVSAAMSARWLFELDGDGGVI